LNSLCSSETIRISVILSAGGRREVLDKCLSALSSQTLPRSEFEVLIDGHGSGGARQEVIRKHMSDLQIYCPMASKGSDNAARSGVLLQARGEYVLFLDDDAIAERDLLDRHCAAHQGCKSDYVHIMGKSGLADLNNRSIIWPCNVSVRREAISRSALFDYESRVSTVESLMLRKLLNEKELALQTIYESDGWKALSLYYRFKGKIFPYGSPMWRLGREVFGFVRSLLKKSGTYRQWIQKHEPSKNELHAQKKAELSFRPLISIVAPVCNTPPKALQKMVESLLAQTYEKWEMCLSLGADEAGVLRPMIEKYMEKDSRISAVFPDRDKGIADCTNEAAALAKGEYAGFLDPGDMLSPFAIHEVVRAVDESGNPDIIYSDEDRISIADFKRSDPSFKPDYSPHLLRSTNYIGGLLICRKSLGDETGWFRKDCDGARYYDFVLRLSEKAERVAHIPKILYHRREAAESSAASPEITAIEGEAGQKALEDHLRRLNRKATVEPCETRGFYSIRYSLVSRPLVSILIPNRDHSADLERCVLSIIERSTYTNFEILIVENGSREDETFRLYERLMKTYGVRVLTWERDFNYSAVCNFAAGHAEGDFLLFLNNDTEVISPEWMERMLEQAQWDEVGATGAKLLFHDGSIQHAGITVEGSTDMAHRCYRFSDSPSRNFRELHVVQNVLAVTGACLLTRRELFIREGRFDEALKYYYNDADYCLRLFEKGLLNVWTPHAVLYHHEMATMKEDSASLTAQMQKDRERFCVRWSHIQRSGDPYFSRHLRMGDNRFVLKI
jgi:GT2 family glycosyltransferase